MSIATPILFGTHSNSADIGISLFALFLKKINQIMHREPSNNIIENATKNLRVSNSMLYNSLLAG
jgi:lauroyl/myristoyl acyltransferase